MSRQAQIICPCSGWSKDVGSSIHQPPLMLQQWHGFLVMVFSLSLRFWQEPIRQGSGLQLCMTGVSNSLRYCNTWGTVIPAYHEVLQYLHTIVMPWQSPNRQTKLVCDKCDINDSATKTWIFHFRIFLYLVWLLVYFLPLLFSIYEQ